MAIQFSHVTLYNANDDSYDSFLARGIPQNCFDLENYKHYDNFIEYLEEDTDIDVEVDTYLYGEGDIVVPSIEEIDYEVADFILTHGDVLITEEDGTPLLEIKQGDFLYCNDMQYRDELMSELRKGEGFEDRYNL